MNDIVNLCLRAIDELSNNTSIYHPWTNNGIDYYTVRFTWGNRERDGYSYINIDLCKVKDEFQHILRYKIACDQICELMITEDEYKSLEKRMDQLRVQLEQYNTSKLQELALKEIDQY
jgi:hypothetical protein